MSCTAVIRQSTTAQRPFNKAKCCQLPPGWRSNHWPLQASTQHFKLIDHIPDHLAVLLPFPIKELAKPTVQTLPGAPNGRLEGQRQSPVVLQRAHTISGPAMASKPQGGGGGRGGGGRGGPRPTYEMKVAADLEYATQRLSMLKERYNRRQEVLGAQPPLRSVACHCVAGGTLPPPAANPPAGPPNCPGPCSRSCVQARCSSRKRRMRNRPRSESQRRWPRMQHHGSSSSSSRARGSNSSLNRRRGPAEACLWASRAASFEMCCM